MNKEKLRSLQIIHLALTLGSLVYIFITGMIAFKPLHLYPAEEEKVFVGVAIGLMLLMAVLSRIIFNGRLQKAKAESSNEAKMDIYRAAFIVNLAMLEGATLFCCTVTMITGSYISVALAFLGSLLLLLQKPTELGLMEDLGIPAERNN